MSESAVAEGWTGDGREPAIEDGELRSQRGQYGQLVRREVIQNVSASGQCCAAG